MVRDIVCSMEINENQAAAKSEYKGSIFYFALRPVKISLMQNQKNILKSWAGEKISYKACFSK